MYFGSLIQSGYGDPDKHVAHIDAQLIRSGTSLVVMVTPATGWGDANFGIYYNGTLAGIAYGPEGDTSLPVTFPVKSAGTKSIVVLRHGADDTTDMRTVARIRYEATTAKQVTHEFTWPSEIVGAADENNDDIDFLGTWSITGYGIQNTYSTEKATRRRFALAVTVSGSDATVTLSNASGVVATGTDSFPGTVTLSEANDSGVSGTVVVGAAAATDTGYLYFRWPASMGILRGLADPPTASVGSEPFNEEASATWTEPTELAAGTYYYRLRPVSDTGENGTETATIAETILDVPGPVSDVAYASGDATNTVLSFTASATVGATYNLYLQNIGDAFIDTATPAATAIAGSTTINLPAVTGYPGTAYAVIRAENGGVEEKGGELIALEYDAAGDYVQLRPNTPGIENVEISDGLTVTASVVYPTVGALAAASALQLFIREADAAYDFGTPADTSALTIFDGVNYIQSLSATAATTGWYFITAKAATAGGVQSSDYAPEESVYLSDSAMAAPTSVASFVSRG